VDYFDIWMTGQELEDGEVHHADLEVLEARHRGRKRWDIERRAQVLKSKVARRLRYWECWSRWMKLPVIQGLLAVDLPLEDDDPLEATELAALEHLPVSDFSSGIFADCGIASR
jgi:hypothetical protein